MIKKSKIIMKNKNLKIALIVLACLGLTMFGYVAYKYDFRVAYTLFLSITVSLIPVVTGIFIIRLSFKFFIKEMPGIMNDFVKIKTIFKKAFMNENN